MPQLECKYPVKPFDVWSIRMFIQSDIQPKTAKDIADEFNITPAKARRMLEPMVKKGYVYKRSITFWNGMFYAQRWYYW